MKKLFLSILLITSGTHIFGTATGDIIEQTAKVKNALRQGIKKKSSRTWLTQEYELLIQELAAVERLALAGDINGARAKVNEILQENPQYSYITLDDLALESWLAPIGSDQP